MAMCYLKFIMSKTEKSLIKCPGEPGPATRCPRHSPRLPAGLCVMCPFSLLSRIHRAPFCVSRLNLPRAGDTRFENKETDSGTESPSPSVVILFLASGLRHTPHFPKPRSALC